MTSSVTSLDLAKAFRVLDQEIRNADKSEETDLKIVETFNSFSPDLRRELAQAVSPSCHSETLLLLAVYYQREKLVDVLLNEGADTQYMNITGESVSTYWPFGFETKLSPTEEQRAIRILLRLHHEGVSFYQNGIYSYGLVKRVGKFNLEFLRPTLEQLGYVI